MVPFSVIIIITKRKVSIFNLLQYIKFEGSSSGLFKVLDADLKFEISFAKDMKERLNDVKVKLLIYNSF